MRKTLLLTLILTFSICPINAQNFLKSLYSLEQFPKEMQKSKAFIEEVCSDILIYNYIYGGNNSSQFDIKSKNGLKINFPFNDEFYLDFLDKTTKENLKTYTFHIDYEFKYLNYYDEFELDESIFSLPSIFDLATTYYDLDEYSLITKVLFHYKPELDYKTKRLVFFKDLSHVLKLEVIPDFDAILDESKSENLMNKEIEEIMLDAILEETEYEYEEITSLIFDFFILNKKSDTKTTENLKRIFENNNLINEIETNILQPKINITLSQGGYFNIPKKYLTINQSEFKALPINTIEIRIDFKNNKILIDFKNKASTNITIQKALLGAKEIKDVTIDTRKVSLEISNDDLKFKILKYNPYKPLDNEMYKIKLNQ